MIRYYMLYICFSCLPSFVDSEWNLKQNKQSKWSFCLVLQQSSSSHSNAESAKPAAVKATPKPQPIAAKPAAAVDLLGLGTVHNQLRLIRHKERKK